MVTFSSAGKLNAARRPVVALACVLALAGAAHSQPAPAAPAQAPAPRPASIDRNGVLILLRSTLLALDHANKTGNYTVLRDLGSATFRAYNAAQIADTFAPHRRDRLDLSGVSVLEPQLSAAPTIGADGLMRLEGVFPSVPSQVNFSLVFAPEDRIWRLAGLSLRLSPSGPEAPPTPPAPAEPTAETAKPAPPQPQRPAPAKPAQPPAR